MTSLLNGITEPGWRDALIDPIVQQQYDTIQRLAIFLKEERIQNHVIYPPMKQIFDALNVCPIENVQLIILGQDPYHRYGQGHGLAFSVQSNVKRLPPSLQNIYKELIDDVGIKEPEHGNLLSWSKRGVLLLNTIFI